MCCEKRLRLGGSVQVMGVVGAKIDGEDGG